MFIQVYDPAVAAAEEVVNRFYRMVEEVLDNIPGRDFHVIMGDLNTKRLKRAVT